MKKNVELKETPESASAVSPASRLPTCPRNALRKIFDRPDFLPEEVAALGHRRLKLAEGIGEKGLQLIMAWLAAHGQVPAPDPERRESTVQCRDDRALIRAVRLLRAHGYHVSAPGALAASISTRGWRISK